MKAKQKIHQPITEFRVGNTVGYVTGKEFLKGKITSIKKTFVCVDGQKPKSIWGLPITKSIITQLMFYNQSDTFNKIGLSEIDFIHQLENLYYDNCGIELKTSGLEYKL